MRFSKSVLAAASLVSLAAPVAAQGDNGEWPVLDNGLTDIVQWYEKEFTGDEKSTHGEIQGPLQLLRQRRASLHLFWGGRHYTVRVPRGTMLIRLSSTRGGILSLNYGETCSRKSKLRGE